MSGDQVSLRPEQPADYRTVEELTREAFWNHHVPGCDEHYLVHIMRGSGSFIHELDIVATEEGKIVGNIMYTKGKILCDRGGELPVICFGPISVRPEFQGRGIGAQLIEYTKDLARKLGHRAILIYGDPAYYRRFGFVAAETYGIATADNQYAAPLQACELVEGALSHCPGRFLEDVIYEINEAEARQFDLSFPPREFRDDLPSQARFRQLVRMRRPRL